MDSMETILNTFLPDRIPSGRQDQIFTPSNIAKEMLDALPDEVWNSRTTFLDPTCKSGIFLYEIYKKLMESNAVIKEYPDRKERHFHIINNQLYGIALDKQCQLISMRTAYGQLKPDSHIITIENYIAMVKNPDQRFLYEVLKKEFNTVKFDVVIGNPPYNRGMDLDFVDLGYKLSNKYTCMITPAKWQTAAANQKVASRMTYGEFRKQIVPHMSKVVFYPDSLDIFGIAEASGISYYLIDKNLHEKCNITNISVLSPVINSKETRSILNSETLWNYGNSIVNKVKSTNGFKPYHIKEVTELKTYTINVNKQLLNCLSRVWDWDASKIKAEYIGKGGCLFDKDGKAKVFGNPKLITASRDDSSGTSINLFTTDSVDEAKSFVSWMYSKFVGFLIIINKYAQNIMSDNGWRFVPAPEAFDHIFTDEELYQKYNLTSEEINIIESVIKERK